MVDETKILGRVGVRRGCWVDGHLGEGKHTRNLPLIDGGLDLGCPHEIRLVRRTCTIRLGNIVVRAADLMLGTVAALGEGFITANVATLARLASLARLGVAAARGTTARTGHLDEDFCEVR